MKNAMISLKLFFALTLITGVIYPLAVTLVGRVVFSDQASGSLVKSGDRVVGSSLIGQKFVQEKYFWARPSATDYNPLPSGGSNFAPTSKKLVDFAKEQRAKFPEQSDLPHDLVFASASGLDPHLTPQAIQVQIARVVKARGWDAEKQVRLEALVQSHTSSRQLAVLGEVRVNVLELNMDLDALQ